MLGCLYCLCCQPVQIRRRVGFDLAAGLQSFIISNSRLRLIFRAHSGFFGGVDCYFGISALLVHEF